MAELSRISESGLAGEPSDAQWRDRMLAYARREDSEFTALRPSETGLPITVYASENAAYPTIIVDSTAGVRFSPSPGSIALRIGEKTGDQIVDLWIGENLAALRDYCAGEIDTYAFNQQMRSITPRPVEMPNYNRGRYNAP